MRAIVQEGYGSADVLKLREIALPTVADDGVLVRVHAASVNALDSHLVYSPLPGRGFFGPPSPRRAVRGVDIAGTVETVGRSVTRFKPGDAVFGVSPGGFAEYASTREDRLAAKSPRLTFQQAAALPVAGSRRSRASAIRPLSSPGNESSFMVQAAALARSRCRSQRRSARTSPR